MATFPQTPNPYQSPTGEDAAIGPVRRPGGLIAVCVITLVLGGLGIMTSLYSLAALTFQEQIQKTFALQQQPGVSDELVKVQAEMQQKILAVQKRYQAVNLGLAAVKLLLAASLVLGGIWVLRLHPNGCSLLTGAFVAAIVFEIVQTAAGAAMQIDTSAVMSEMFGRMAQLGQPQTGSSGGLPVETFVAMTKAFAVIGIGVFIAFALAKIVFYVVGFRYLRRPNIRALFPKPLSP